MEDNKEIQKIETEKINDLPSMEVGNMMLFKSKESSINSPVFYIKENNKNIKDIVRNLENFTIQLRDIVIYGGYCNPFIIMLRLDEEDKYIYGQWFNKYNNKDRDLIKEIIFQDKLEFCIVNIDNRVQIRFNCRNVYKKSIWNYFKISSNDRRWSKEMFESEVIAINLQLKRKKDLFYLLD